MGAIRVALLGEGAGDLGGEAPTFGRPVPREPLLEGGLGAAHLIVRRALAFARALPEAAILFERPLVLQSGREARGSDLLVPRRARRLVAYPPTDRPPPDLVVVLVDEDGDGGRAPALDVALPRRSLHPRVVGGVAVRELEGWLISDRRAVRDLALPEPPSNPDALAPGAAKAWLANALGLRGAVGRRDLARAMDVERARKSSPSLGRFVEALRG